LTFCEGSKRLKKGEILNKIGEMGQGKVNSCFAPVFYHSQTLTKNMKIAIISEKKG
jgi:hypothetical protein